MWWLGVVMKIGISLDADNRLHRLRYRLSAHRARDRGSKGGVLGQLQGVGVGEARDIFRTRPARDSKVTVLRLRGISDAIGLIGRLWSRLRL